MRQYDPQYVLEIYEMALQILAGQPVRNAPYTPSDYLILLQSIKEDQKGFMKIDFHAKGAPLETLIALCEEGPLDDGSVPSKVERDQLVTLGYAARISIKGEQGYNAATYKGNNAYADHFNASSLDEAKANRLVMKAMRDASKKDK